MNDTNPVFHSLTVIEENIRQKLTVDGLADSIHMSKYHYQQVFREIFGDSVMRYVNRRRLSLAAADLVLFFQSLSEDIVQGISKHDGGNDLERTTGKTYSDLAFQSNILLFYLRGEVQKLGQRLPSQKQEDVFDGICGKMNETVRLARCAKEDDAMREIAGNLQWVYEKAEAEGKKLGAYGGPVLFIADEIRKLADYV
ncbi:MAG: hypothetical protein K2P28_03755, partial [Lachnospiraceae bacterium]|nr:hypothetical protein [Lachnospiraceae bacterium]